MMYSSLNECPLHALKTCSGLGTELEMVSVYNNTKVWLILGQRQNFKDIDTELFHLWKGFTLNMAA